MNEIQQLPHPDLRDGAFFFDLDGTLAELQPRPEQVFLAAELRDGLRRLSQRTPALAVVSGRPLAQIDALVAPLRLPAAGIHGAEWRDGSGQVYRQAPDASLLASLERELNAACAEHPGLRLENKGVAFALHFRGAEALEGEARALAEGLVRRYAQFVLQPGKCVFEFKPRGASKGEVIRRFMGLPPFVGKRPVFLGDDLTDEAGFEVVNAMEGLSIKVGEGASQAQWRLPSVAAVGEWLNAVLAAAEPSVFTRK